ncbi:ArsR family transcriptional regulator [Candidatus Dojkabacteria bacterium]|nr:ArsR family transcriptional regulator [Candidatus Dojkabacteria bacterium]
MSINEIQKYLESIGLSSVESKIYLKLLEVGSCSISEISRKTELPRTTVDRHLHRLSNKGLISKTVRKSTKLFTAETPLKLSLLLSDKAIELEDRLSNIKKKQKKLGSIVKNIQKLLPESDESENLSIKYFEGVTGVQNTYKEISNSNASIIYTFLNVTRYFDIFPATHDLFKKFLKNNPESKILEILVGNTKSIKLTNAIQDIGERCICKTGDASIAFNDLDILIYDGTVAMIELKSIDPTVILIKSEIISNGLKDMHKMLWNYLPRLLK